MNTNATRARWSTIALVAAALATFALGLGAGFLIGRTIGAHAAHPTSTPAQDVPAGMSKDAAGIEATIRDEFRTLYQGNITKEQWQHYCDDLITAESRAHVNGCEAPKDYMGHKDEIRRIENIVIDGDKATATVDYHTDLYGGQSTTITETLYWEGGRWKLDSRMRNDR